MWHNVLDCSLQFLTVFFQTIFAVGEEEPKEELKKRLSAFDNYFKQNDKHLGGEPILLLFPGWALMSFVLYTTQIIASQLRVCSKGKDDSGQKKSHCPLDFHQSLLLLHLLPLCSLPFFSLFSMGIYCPATISESLSKPRGWLVSPWKSLYSSPLTP